MSKDVKGVTPELVIETLKLLEPRLVPAEYGVIDLHEETRDKWEKIIKENENV